MKKKKKIFKSKIYFFNVNILLAQKPDAGAKEEKELHKTIIHTRSRERKNSY